MKITAFILFIQITYLTDLVKSHTKLILIDNEEYICSSTHDQDSEIKPIKNFAKTGCTRKYNAHNGYNLFSGETFSGYYKYHKEPTLWIDAKEICESECAYLAIPNSKEEADFLVSLFKVYPVPNINYKSYVLIGLNDIVKEGEFVTVLGTHLNTTGFTSWYHGGYPTNSAEGIEDCVSLYNNGLLINHSCALPITFICEKDKV